MVRDIARPERNAHHDVEVISSMIVETGRAGMGEWDRQSQDPGSVVQTDVHPGAQTVAEKSAAVTKLRSGLARHLQTRRS